MIKNNEKITGALRGNSAIIEKKEKFLNHPEIIVVSRLDINTSNNVKSTHLL